MDQVRVCLFLLMVATLVMSLLLLSKKSRRRRRWWVRPIYQLRNRQGDFHNLMTEMRAYDPEMFFHYTRLTIEQFDDLVGIIGPYITKKSNRTPLSAEHRLAITLRFLATGSSFQTLAFQFRVGKSTVCKVVHETCQAIWVNLHKEVFDALTTQNWLKIADEFSQRWNFPHCIGALDGKHIRIQAPANTGTSYFNYKHYFSIILMAICGANYKFTFVDIGAMGSESDGGVFSRTTLARLLQQNNLNIPPPSRISAADKLPYWFLADEAFPLKENIMRPYPGQSLSMKESIFNYRLLGVAQLYF